MARDIDTIKTIINDQIKAEPSLYNVADPDAEGYINPDASTSVSSIWAGLRNVVARAHQTLELMWDVYKRELDQRAASAIPGTLRWYVDIAKEFQYGDPLTVKEGKVMYATIDESKRIVKYAAGTEVSGLVLLKVAKDNAGEYEKLETGSELPAFRAYMNERKFAGTRTQIISTDPDLVWLKLNVYYNPLLIPADVLAAVQTAINGYLKGIYFTGVFNVNLLRDAIEKVSGVAAGGVDIQFVKIKPAGGAYTTVVLNYTPISGYYKIDPAYPLTDVAQLNLIPANV